MPDNPAQRTGASPGESRHGEHPKAGGFDLAELHAANWTGASGRRPALVLSPEAYNSKTGLALLCPVTSKVKGYPFEAPPLNDR